MTPHRTTALLATAALLLVAGSAQGAYNYGSIVDKNDYDFQQAPSIRGATPVAGKWVLPCFRDLDGDGRLWAGPETLYLAVRTGLAATCAYVNVKDVRLTAAGSLAGGSEVKGGDVDEFAPLTPLDNVSSPRHAVRIFNGDGQPGLRKGDTVYLDLVQVASPTPGVQPGDVRLSPFGTLKAGSRVQEGDPDQNFPLDELQGGIPKTLYTVNLVFEFGKGWYLNSDLDAGAGGAVEEGDVRLNGAVPNPFADIPANVGNPGKVVDGLSFSADVVPAGSPFQAYIRAKNPTGKVGSALVETRLDGVLVDARGTPTLAKDESATLVVSLVAPLEPGQHKVQAGETTAFFEVESVAANAPATTDEVAPVAAAVKEQGTPAMSGLAMMATLGLAMLFLRRTA